MWYNLFDEKVNPRRPENMTLNERYTAVKRKLFDRAYSKLNEEQRYAVYTVNGPLLVLAGAGSGKTTVLVKRIEFIIKYGNAVLSDYMPFGITEEDVDAYEDLLRNGSDEDLKEALNDFAYGACPAWRVLAITFTNKAANEMKERLDKAFGDEEVSSQIWTGTFHKICMRILRRYSAEAGLGASYTIYDTDDSKKAIKAATERINLDEKNYPSKSVMSFISRAKENLVTPEEALANVEADPKANLREKNYARIYAEYQKGLDSSDALDFDDIIMKTVQLLEANAEVREYYQNKFKYVLVDEYQDTNYAQFKLTELLSGGFKNLMVVGDDDQSIYKFRGATIENILNFDKSFPAATVIKLEQNYRSTQNILDAANAVIANNKGRKGKNLWTSSGKGNKITLINANDQDDEARNVADVISSKVAAKEYSFKDFAILYRANAQSRSFENTLIKSGIPYRIMGGVRFGDREEIKDMMAYLQLAANRKDNERLKRIINKPKRKIGDRPVEILTMISAETNRPMLDILEDGERYGALVKFMPQLRVFVDIMNDLSKKKDELPLNEFFEYAIDRTGYRADLEARGEEGSERLDNLKELVSNAVEYMANAEEPSLEGFLEESILVSDVDRYDESDDKVALMTIHSAKGLEFPIVFLPGMEEGIFPSEKTIYADNADEELEEERRLAYVAITRAKKELYVIHTAMRVYFGRTTNNQLSRFIKEIPEENIEMKGAVKSRPTQKKLYYTESTQTSKPSATVNTLTVTASPAKSASPASGMIEPGKRVKHRAFGEGTVLSSKKMGNDILYEIIFDTAGTKKLFGNYAKLTEI